MAAPADGLWFKDAVFYELHVRSFQDSNADGIGDFPGLTSRLDYLQKLGVDCLWLMPFYPSPLRDDGYDIADYKNVNPDYGTLDDFRRFLEEAHARGLRVIADLVVNHTSDAHFWFQEALKGPDNPYHDYYVWSDTPERYKDARVIFIDTEHSNWAWEPRVGKFYWHRFFSSQPDLNYDNPRVQEEMLDVVRFWLELGLDGFRVDAVPYLFEREGTNCENLPETHAFLARLRRFVDEHFPGRLLLAEANQWPEDVIHYFGTAENPEFHMCFNFPLMPRIFMALRREERRPIEEIVGRLPPIREDCQWAIFLRNHDELTLEMVTDEERDYMYSEYAKEPRMKVNLGIRRRLAPLLEGGRRQLELVHSLIFTLPGSPILYYGDEIAMGDNIYLGDRHAVRTPMQWSIDRNAGFSRADASRLYSPVIVDPPYGYQGVNVEAQERSPTSFLNWMRRILAVRKQYRVFGRGEMIFLRPQNPKVLAYVLSYEDQEVLVVNNLSRFSQPVELDLRPWAGKVPVEMIGGTPFPPIGELPYFVTLGPHSFFWFRLDRQ
ncbi:Trehalose synthase/amylase TreS [Calidithermus terrae]|uniref:maltose alpha-D-glucosyltransferase n=1 Tax=Calidithermus terrae TaxID=1408545 RepID=A0A399F4V8_9DEIN|nr:maltose alpha-D-glucosyltransferase [Calidithermus terrae]RIH90319.1 Trehalose synthase/amylase TreS [Calidithermus terrae]